MIETWEDLAFWRSEIRDGLFYSDWVNVQEKLNEMDKKGVKYCPRREDLFKALDVCEYSSVRVCLVGQDPYPNPGHACGIAFSVLPTLSKLPASLKNIFKVYKQDLHYPDPLNGDLTPWCKQGVLLWNSYPTCEEFKPGSHRWQEWATLTREIIEQLSEKEVVFVFLGAVAREFSQFATGNHIIETSHPSPLGFEKGFSTSRLFSSINARLKEPIDWKL